MNDYLSFYIINDPSYIYTKLKDKRIFLSTNTLLKLQAQGTFEWVVRCWRQPYFIIHNKSKIIKRLLLAILWNMWKKKIIMIGCSVRWHKTPLWGWRIYKLSNLFVVFSKTNKKMKTTPKWMAIANIGLRKSKIALPRIYVHFKFFDHFKHRYLIHQRSRLFYISFLYYALISL